MSKIPTIAELTTLLREARDEQQVLYKMGNKNAYLRAFVLHADGLSWAIQLGDEPAPMTSLGLPYPHWVRTTVTMTYSEKDLADRAKELSDLIRRGLQTGSRVFVIQQVMRKDIKDGTLVPRYDINAAKEFGSIEHLLGPSARPFQPETVLGDLHEKLEDFNDSDYLLAIGNPCLIGFATAIAARNNRGRVKLLQWSGKDLRYLKVQATLWEE